VVASDGAKVAFGRTLWETIIQFGWRLRAYVIMSNHYHLALETPQPNLSVGIHRLQSAFAIRFNRFRGERGHLFQGRYHALRSMTLGSVPQGSNPNRPDLLIGPLLDPYGIGPL